MALSRAYRMVVAAVLGGVLIVAGAPVPTPGMAAASREMSDYLAAHPGGVPVSANEISYGDGAVLVTLRPPVGVYALADCPWGWYCFYDRPDFGYPRGKLSSCGRQNLADWQWQFRIGSAHYNMASGSATFYYNDTALFSVGVGNPVRADAAPWRDWANYVNRRC
ncbi:hypothetical protein K7640_10825 [Micromonospora sp. PLK6-60]|uniref:hypothetical protein n=1 Tax=Micromonospora sp. PLK6-60 TaxID=2873383 RepID=UPI001CA74E02|nr:hypothetical protein [Micromonospora sp. PLK6-60]MBY8872332.1 hypothetical protein [Micromonospora sp. PLK6-60]